jgi:hypothetical protein
MKRLVEPSLGAVAAGRLTSDRDHARINVLLRPDTPRVACVRLGLNIQEKA